MGSWQGLYELGNTLLADDHGVVQRARRRSDNEPVLIRTCRVTPMAESRSRLRAEADIAKAMQGNGVPAFVDLHDTDGRPALILQDPCPESIPSNWQNCQSIDELQSFAFAALHSLSCIHEAGFVHLHLSPSSILWIDDGHAWIIGATGKWVSEFPSSPKCMAPEQSGGWNATPDTRSDLYAMGCLFYLAATGKLPFSGDHLALVRQHQIALPTDIILLRPDLPDILRRIIMVMLAKNPDDRPGSAKVLMDLFTTKTASPELLSAKIRSRLNWPRTLFGRQEPEDRLREFSSRLTMYGEGNIVLVKGVAGIGKTVLVNQELSYLSGQNAIIATGKCDQLVRERPYGSLSSIMTGLGECLLALPEEQLSSLRRIIGEHIGLGGNLLQLLSPTLRKAIDATVPAPNLPPAEMEQALLRAVTLLLQTIAEQCPLAIFLDDLQWVDPASGNILETIARQGTIPQCLIFLAMREEELPPPSPEALTIEAMPTVQGIALKPIDDPTVNSLLEHVLGGKAHASLVDLMMNESSGNPFFLRELLTVMWQSGLLVSVDNQWQWIGDMSILGPETLSGLMAFRISSLSPDAIDLLSQAACLGNAIDSDLVRALQHANPATDAIIELAIEQGFMLKKAGVISFSHDSIQEAFYTQIPEAQRSEKHATLARDLLSCHSENVPSRVLYVVIEQFMRGVDSLKEPSERLSVGRLALQATNQAWEGAAWRAGYEVALFGLNLVENDKIASTDLVRALHVKAGECAYLSAIFEDAESHLDKAYTLSGSFVEKAEIAALQIQLKTTCGDMLNAVEIGKHTLSIGNHALPSCSEEVNTEDMIALLDASLADKSTDDLLSIPNCEDMEIVAVMNILSIMIIPTYFTTPWLLVPVVSGLCQLGLKHGHCEESGYGYIWLGLSMIERQTGRYRDGYRYGKIGMDIIDHQKNPVHRVRAHVLFGDIINFFANHLLSDRPHLETALRLGQESGERLYTCYTCNHIITNMLVAGDPLDLVLARWSELFDIVKAAGDPNIIAIFTSQHRFISSMIGNSCELGNFDGGNFDGQMFDLAAFEESIGRSQMIQMQFWHVMWKLAAKIIANDLSGVPELIRLGDSILDSDRWNMESTLWLFYAALAECRLIVTCKDDMTGGLTRSIEKRLTLLKAWQEACPANFEDRYTLVQAEFSASTGQGDMAIALYEKALHAASNSGFVQQESLICESAARCYESQGNRRLAQIWWREARDNWRKWGATAKVKQLEMKVPNLEPLGEDNYLSSLDTMALVKGLQAISSNLDLRILIPEVLDIVQAESGATTVALLLPDNEGAMKCTTLKDENGLHTASDLCSDLDARVPQKLIRAVAHGRQHILLESPAESPLWSGEQAFSKRKPLSAIGLPLCQGDRLIGVLYMEHAHTEGAFSPSRIQILAWFGAQAAIAIEQAQSLESLRLSMFAVEHIADAVFWIDEKGGFSYANSTAVEMLGYSTDEFRSLKIFEIEEERSKGSWNEYWKRLQHQQSDLYEATFRTKENQSLPVEVRSNYMEYHGIKINCSFVRDISEKVRDREEKEALELHLRQAQKLEALGTLASGIAHDFNNLLFTIVGHLDLIRMEKPGTAEANAYLENIDMACARAKDLVSHILAFGQQTDANYSQVNVAQLVNESISLLKSSLPPSISLRSKVDENSGLTKGDPTQIHQVIMNLCTNAYHAMEANGGELNITLDRLVLKNPRHAGDQWIPAGSYVHLTVKDSGSGIEAAILHRIFDPYFTTKGEGKGTGLGLAMVHGIITEMNGFISVSSPPGEGATFEVFFPHTANKEENNEIEVEKDSESTRNEHIMVVEDELLTLEMIKFYLANQGYAVSVYTDPITALDAFSDNPTAPNCLLTDLQMPGMMGDQLIEKILKVRADLPIVVMTGNITLFDVNRCDELNVKKLLLKPFKMQDLAEALRAALEA